MQKQKNKQNIFFKISDMIVFLFIVVGVILIGICSWLSFMMIPGILHLNEIFILAFFMLYIGLLFYIATLIPKKSLGDWWVWLCFTLLYTFLFFWQMHLSFNKEMMPKNLKWIVGEVSAWMNICVIIFCVILNLCQINKFILKGNVRHSKLKIIFCLFFAMSYIFIAPFFLGTYIFDWLPKSLAHNLSEAFLIVGFVSASCGLICLIIDFISKTSFDSKWFWFYCAFLYSLFTLMWVFLNPNGLSMLLYLLPSVAGAVAILCTLFSLLLCVMHKQHRIGVKMRVGVPKINMKKLDILLYSSFALCFVATFNIPLFIRVMLGGDFFDQHCSNIVRILGIIFLIGLIALWAMFFTNIRLKFNLPNLQYMLLFVGFMFFFYFATCCYIRGGQWMESTLNKFIVYAVAISCTLSVFASFFLYARSKFIQHKDKDSSKVNMISK